MKKKIPKTNPKTAPVRLRGSHSSKRGNKTSNGKIFGNWMPGKKGRQRRP